MKKILLLLLLITISTICHAKEPCINKTFVRDYQFNINSQPYKFTSYLCEDKDEDDDDAIFSTPGILEIHGQNFNKTLKNVIGLAGQNGIMFWEWNNKPEFFYYIISSESTEADIPIIIKDNNLMVDCVYINRRLKNLMVFNYSYCGNLQIVEDGFGDVEVGFGKLIPESYLESTYYYSNFTENNESLQYKKFDV